MTDGTDKNGGRAVPEPYPFPHWSYTSAGVEVRFVGRTPKHLARGHAQVLAALGEAVPRRVGWLAQRHSATVRPASDGPCGEGDGLWTTQPGLALCIASADCVPVVCSSRAGLAAIHAGWRGLVAGVIEATLAALAAPTVELEAWLGPAIGRCCYEVGDDVAASVSASSSGSVVTAGRSGRPHLDLHQAAEIQLRKLGIARVRRVPQCTKCHSDLLWSYRGDRATRGRNLALAWLSL